ncbi:MAG: NAD(P)/FAD-dependent oxidoreductase [Anaerolineales bacterium]|nr:NAD(P)/FAD-dependent oxidoreductase [Anaerolineales bacterium]
MSTKYDAIIIGAGHNGLTTAAYLARAGQRVLVLERRDVVGGSVVTESPWPGYRVDTLQHFGGLRPDIVRDLDLARFGLTTTRVGLTALQPGGGALELGSGGGARAQAIGAFNRTDAERWPAFTALMAKVAGFLNEVYAAPFPRVPQIDAAEAPALAQLGLKLRGLGKKDMIEAVRVLPMSMLELLDEWFESDLLRGALAARGVHGLMQGPMGAGTAFLFLHLWANNDSLFQTRVKGGAGALSEALAQAATGFGAELRLGAEVAQVKLSGDRAAGVVLANGEEITAQRVVSALDPRRTFLGLVGPDALDPEFVWATQNIKLRGCVAKVNLALDGLPTFTGVTDAGLRGALTLSPSLNDLERAYDAAKYGGLSERPYLEVSLPTLAEPGLAPDGKHLLSVHMQFAPYRGEQADWATRIEAIVVNALAQLAPDLPGRILHSQVLTPRDLETRFGLSEGNLYHGEMMLDQILFMRPLSGWAQHRTPIENLYLCGPGTHPGGGVSGASGRNAARQILKDQKA